MLFNSKETVLYIYLNVNPNMNIRLKSGLCFTFTDLQNLLNMANVYTFVGCCFKLVYL